MQRVLHPRGGGTRVWWSPMNLLTGRIMNPQQNLKPLSSSDSPASFARVSLSLQKGEWLWGQKHLFLYCAWADHCPQSYLRREWVICRWRNDLRSIKRREKNNLNKNTAKQEEKVNPLGLKHCLSISFKKRGSSLRLRSEMHVVTQLKTGCMHSDSYQSYAALDKGVKLLVVLSQSRSVRCLTSPAGIFNTFIIAGV